MDMQKAEMNNDPLLLPLEQVTVPLSSLDTGMNGDEGETVSNPRMLPFEMVIEILSWLPVIALLRFKCVCKSWCRLINSQDFTKLHLSRSLQANSDSTLIVYDRASLHTINFYDPPFDATKLHSPRITNAPRLGSLVGSCNGLLCFSNQGDLVLSNPATRAYKQIPRDPSPNKFIDLCPPVGFAYDCVSDDYKILRFTRPWIVRNGIKEWGTLLYSLRSNAWEILSNPPWDWDNVKNPCIAFNNSLYWLESKCKDIKCFDLFTHRFYEVPFPNKVSPGYSPTLAHLRGKLWLVTYYLDIWILKEYGVPESWTRVCRCPFVQWNRLFDSGTFSCWGSGLSLACSKDGRKIMIALVGEGKHFLCCDLDSKEITKIDIPGLKPRIRTNAIRPWVESLVRLPD